MEQAIALYDREKHRDHGWTYGLDTFAWASANLGIVTCLSTSGERSFELARDGLAWAKKLKHIPSIGIALLYLAIVHHLNGDKDGTAKRSGELLELAEQYGLPAYEGYGLLIHAWATDNASLAEPVFDQLTQLGCRTCLPYFGSMLADIHMRDGHYDKALQRVEESIAMGEEIIEFYFAAELYRQKGLLLSQYFSGQKEAARQAMEKAISMADERHMIRIGSLAKAQLKEMINSI